MSTFTQIEGPHDRGICEVVVGLDFGTSSTKVVLRTPYLQDQAYAVDFTPVAHANSRHLLPSQVWLGPDDSFSLKPVLNGARLRDIKHHLMLDKPVPTVADGDRTYDPKVAATGFLALTLIKARHWFVTEYQQRIQGMRLDWSVNLGLPSADYDDESLCATYRDVIYAAWWLSVAGRKITLTAVKEALERVDQWDEDNDDLDAEIHWIPEVAAEVVGYARSHQRDEGLHILVDVGASTLDVCGFILHADGDGDDCYRLLTADVRSLGVLDLYRRRLNGVIESAAARADQLWASTDPVQPIPEGPDDYLPCQAAMLEAFKTHSGEYQKLAMAMVWETLVAIKVDKDPNSVRWTQQIPIFLTGGGSQMTFYQTMTQKLSKDLVSFYKNCDGLRLFDISRPNRLAADVKDEDYHRLAVAWGLSYPKTDIGKITRPQDILNVPHQTAIDHWDKFVRASDM